ncbi:MAG TPA: hypothetical protein VND92_06385, partial [Vicinamibacterales bacterium]|nr:hypothetical protein [Vicinamibacterales bacterium]
NPVLVFRSLPPGDPIDAADRVAFDAVRDRALARLHDATRPATAVASAATAEASAAGGTFGPP